MTKLIISGLVFVLTAASFPTRAWSQCYSDSGCRLNESCVDRECVPNNDYDRGCRSDSDCPLNSYCEMRQCYEKPAVVRLSQAKSCQDREQFLKF